MTRNSQVICGVPARLFLFALLLLAAPAPAWASSQPGPAARAAYAAPPRVTAAENGARIESIRIQALGVVDRRIVQRYLALHAGDRLTQAGVNRDFENLARLQYYRTILQINPGNEPDTVRLLWIVQAKYLKPTTHPFYGDAPLSAPIQGVGWIVTSPPLNQKAGNISTYSQFARRANLARLLFSQPLTVDPVNGTQTSFITDIFGGRGVYRASQPKAINVFSWNVGAEALWLSQATNGTQVEGGVRLARSTDQLPSAVVATSVYSTWAHPARETELVAGVSHACLSGPNQWYPPFCDQQYRASVTDGIGGAGATSEFQVYSGDYVRYFSLGESTLALHGTESRSGGVIPDSFLLCTIARSYPKPFCGTDAQGFQAEIRIDDHLNQPWQFALFTEEASARVRGSEVAFAPTHYTWYPDSGIGVTYRMVRINIIYGKDGGRIEGELKGAYY